MQDLPGNALLGCVLGLVYRFRIRRVRITRAFPPQKGDGSLEAVENREAAKVWGIVIQGALVAKSVRPGGEEKEADIG